MIIVIDGPAGSGKSSTAKEIANRLDIQYLDSGALYRAITYLWIAADKPDKKSFIELLPDVKLETVYENQTFKVELNGADISDEIRKQHVAENVSKIAAIPEVRKFVNDYMQNLVSSDVYIADGRDLGTAVFTDAALKFYMDASIEERAKRRYKEMKESDKDTSVTLEEVRNNLKDRDFKDQNRSADPLKKADDAIVIDTTGKTFNEQISEMIDIINKQIKLKY